MRQLVWPKRIHPSPSPTGDPSGQSDGGRPAQPRKIASTAGRLKPDSLGVLGILFFVLSAQAPLTGIAGAVPIAVVIGNGAGVPAAYLAGRRRDPALLHRLRRHGPPRRGRRRLLHVHRQGPRAARPGPAAPASRSSPTAPSRPRCTGCTARRQRPRRALRRRDDRLVGVGAGHHGGRPGPRRRRDRDGRQAPGRLRPGRVQHPARLRLRDLLQGRRPRGARPRRQLLAGARRSRARPVWP